MTGNTYNATEDQEYFSIADKLVDAGSAFRNNWKCENISLILEIAETRYSLRLIISS